MRAKLIALLVPIVTLGVTAATLSWSPQLDAAAPVAMQDQAWSPASYHGSLDHDVEVWFYGIDRLLGEHPGAAPETLWQQAGTADTTPDANSSITGGVEMAADVKPAVSSTVATGSTGQGLIPFENFASYPLTTDTTAKVDLGNGNLVLQSTDGALNSAGVPLSNDRFFNSVSAYSGSLGGHWDSALSGFDVGLYIGSTNVYYVESNGASERFTPSGSAWTAPPQLDATLTGSAGSSWTLVMNNTGEKLSFNSSGWLTSDVNNDGIGNTYAYNAAGQTTQVTEASGRYFTVNWTTSGSYTYVSSIVDSAGRTTTYSHNASGQLTEVDSPGSYWEKYSYDSSGRVSEVQGVGTTGSTGILVDFTYDSSNRVTAIKQGTIGSSTYARTTTFSGWGASSNLLVTDGNGNVTTY